MSPAWPRNIYGNNKTVAEMCACERAALVGADAEMRDTALALAALAAVRDDRGRPRVVLTQEMLQLMVFRQCQEVAA